MPPPRFSPMAMPWWITSLVVLLESQIENGSRNLPNSCGVRRCATYSNYYNVSRVGRDGNALCVEHRRFLVWTLRHIVNTGGVVARPGEGI